MIHGRRRKGRKVGVANVASGCGWQMSSRLSECGCAMAGSTGTNTDRYARVGKGSRFPGGSTVTVVAVICAGRNMACRLGLGIDCHIGTTVTSGTVSSSHRRISAGMAHGCRRKGSKGVVAGTTLRIRRNMGTRLANPCGRIVVTIRTPIGHRWRCRCMIKGRTSPCRGRPVASVTLGIAWRKNVSSRFLLGVECRIRQTRGMTGQTLPCCPYMVHRTRHETHETIGMAGITLRTGRNMSRPSRFPLGIGRRITTTVAG